MEKVPIFSGLHIVVLGLTFINKLKKSNDEYNLIHKGHIKYGEISKVLKVNT